MSHLTRSVALAATAVLTLGVLPAHAAPAAPQRGQAQGEAAAGYLVGNLEDGLLSYRPYQPPPEGPVFGQTYTPYDASIDAATGLAAIGGHDDEVTAIADAISANLTDYTDYSYVYRGYTYAGRIGGRTANAVIALQLAGQDPRTHPDGDLVARLEGMLGESRDGLVGEEVRDVETRDGRERKPGNSMGVLGQSLTLTALRQAGSTHVDAVAANLLDRQCPTEGNFDGCLKFPGDADIASTAAAAVALVPLASDADLGTDATVALSRALSYLDDVQLDDGGFPENPDVDPEFPHRGDTMTTGLVVTALRRIATIPRFAPDATPLAVRGASWLRARQLVNVGPCRPYASYTLGAVSPDSRVTGRITAATEGTYVDATARSAEALLSAPAASGTLRARITGRYVAPGAMENVTVLKAAPGSAVCASVGRVQAFADVDGTARFRVRVPERAGTTTYTFTDADGRTAAADITSLGAKALDVRVRSSVARGDRQRVVVTGLASRELMTIRIDGGAVQRQYASAAGVLDTELIVRTSPGTRTLQVVGAFKNRTGSKTFRVTS